MNGIYLVELLKIHFEACIQKNERIVIFSDVKLELLGDLIASYIDAYSSTVLKLCS